MSLLYYLFSIFCTCVLSDNPVHLIVSAIKFLVRCHSLLGFVLVYPFPSHLPTLCLILWVNYHQLSVVLLKVSKKMYYLKYFPTLPSSSYQLGRYPEHCDICYLYSDVDDFSVFLRQFTWIEVTRFLHRLNTFVCLFKLFCNISI